MGPQSARVYWRRRLVVGLGILAVIIVIILIVVRPGGGGTPTPVGTKTAIATTPKASTTPIAGGTCIPANLTLTAVTDKDSYAAGEKPQISMSLKNNGSAPCSLNMGSTQQDLAITSGSEKIWDSKDCQTGAVDATVTIKAGETLTTPAIAWDRTRSSKTTCTATRTEVTAGGASYHLGVTLGAISSKDTKQFLLK